MACQQCMQRCPFLWRGTPAESGCPPGITGIGDTQCTDQTISELLTASPGRSTASYELEGRTFSILPDAQYKVDSS
jgi:hypothetical protein